MDHRNTLWRAGGSAGTIGNMYKTCLVWGILALASPAWSQGIDYDALFTDRADEVSVDDKGLHSLATAGDVTLYRAKEDGKWYNWGVDRSDQGSVGCAAKVITNLRAVAEICTEIFPASQIELVKDVDQKLMAFELANSYPPLSEDAQKRRIEEHAARGKDVFEQIVTDQYGACPKRLETDVIRLARNTAVNLPDLLETPRFVVANPCF